MSFSDCFSIESMAILKISGKKPRGSYRPNGRDDWHILYIIEGKCLVTINDKVIECNPGTVIIYPPGVPQKYDFVLGIKSKYFFAHFIGDLCDELLGSLDKIIYYIGRNANLEEIIYKLDDDYTLKLYNYESITRGMLISVISYIARDINLAMNLPANSKNKIVEICRHMQTKYGDKISIGEYADMCNLSESRFSHLFKEIMGVSPLQYLLDVRINNAKKMLVDTDLSISGISDIVGMQSQNYFSRIFKKYTNLSPLEYRKSMR